MFLPGQGDQRFVVAEALPGGRDAAVAGRFSGPAGSGKKKTASVALDQRGVKGKSAIIHRLVEERMEHQPHGQIFAFFSPARIKGELTDYIRLGKVRPKADGLMVNIRPAGIVYKPLRAVILRFPAVLFEKSWILVEAHAGKLEPGVAI